MTVKAFYCHKCCNIHWYVEERVAAVLDAGKIYKIICTNCGNIINISVNHETNEVEFEHTHDGEISDDYTLLRATITASDFEEYCGEIVMSKGLTAYTCFGYPANNFKLINRDDKELFISNHPIFDYTKPNYEDFGDIDFEHSNCTWDEYVKLCNTIDTERICVEAGSAIPEVLEAIKELTSISNSN